MTNTPPETALSLREQAENKFSLKTSALNKYSHYEVQRLVQELNVHQIELEMQNDELKKERTERNELEALLGTYSDLYELAPVGYFNLDEGGVILAVNLTGAGLLGTERSLLVGRRLAIYLSDETRPVFRDFLERVFSGVNKETCDVEIQLEGRSPIFVQIMAAVAGSKKECRAVVSDINERKLAEEKLKASEWRFRLLSEMMLQGVVYQDANGAIISMNPAASLILGKSSEQLLGSSSTMVEHHTIRENGEPFPGIEHPAMVALQTGLPVSSVIMGVFNPILDEYRWISICEHGTETT